MRALILLLLLPGCALLQPNPVEPAADRFLGDYRDSRSESSDGGAAITPAETHTLDRDAGFLEAAFEEKNSPPAPLNSGIPWLDGLYGVGILALQYATHKYTMAKRDGARVARGEPVGVQKTV
jgi:hypothetical protein